MPSLNERATLSITGRRATVAIMYSCRSHASASVFTGSPAAACSSRAFATLCGRRPQKQAISLHQEGQRKRSGKKKKSVGQAAGGRNDLPLRRLSISFIASQ